MSQLKRLGTLLGILPGGLSEHGGETVETAADLDRETCRMGQPRLRHSTLEVPGEAWD